MEVQDATNPDADDAARDDQPGVETAEDQVDALLRDDDALPDDDDPQPDADDELEDVEIDGKKGKVSKALKDHYLRHADYTRKTQEVAEERRQVEAAKAAAGQPSKELIEGLADVRSLSKQIADIDNLTQDDWDQIDAMDRADGGNRARQLERKKASLTAARAELAGKLQTQERERTEAARGERDKRLQDAEAVLAKDIKGWSPELKSKIGEFAVSQGFTQAELAEVTDPRHVKLLNLARIGAESLRKAATVKKAEAATSSQPAPTVKGSGSPQKTLRQVAEGDDFAAFEKAAQKAIKR